MRTSIALHTISLVVRAVFASAAPNVNLAYGVEPDPEPVGSSSFWWKIVVSAALVLSGGAFAGCVTSSWRRGRRSCMFRLTLGLMGLDELHLRVLASSSDDEKERLNAKKGAFALRRAAETALSAARLDSSQVAWQGSPLGARRTCQDVCCVRAGRDAHMSRRCCYSQTLCVAPSLCFRRPCAPDELRRL
jgi:hypothetical protein